MSLACKWRTRPVCRQMCSNGHTWAATLHAAAGSCRAWLAEMSQRMSFAERHCSLECRCVKVWSANCNLLKTAPVAPPNLRPGRSILASSVGGPPFPAYFPQSGLISLTVVGREGNAVETSIIGREGALGLHSAFGKRRSSRVLLRDSRPWGRNASMRWNLCSKLLTWPATTELASALSFLFCCPATCLQLFLPCGPIGAVFESQ